MTLPVDTLLLPAEVRAAAPEQQRLYASALSFEKLLTTQLAQSLASAVGSGEGDEDDDAGGGSGALGQLRSQLPAQLADAVAQGGGLGLAPQLWKSLVAQAAPSAGARP